MKVKVGDRVYDGKTELVMVILTDKDKENIAAMRAGCTKYCQAPDGVDESKMDQFMVVE